MKKRGPSVHRICDQPAPDDKEDIALYNAKFEIGNKSNGIACVT